MDEAKGGANFEHADARLFTGNIAMSSVRRFKPRDMSRYESLETSRAHIEALHGTAKGITRLPYETNSRAAEQKALA